MSIDRLTAADLTCLLFQLTRFQCTLNGEVSVILAWIGTAPVRLTGIGFQHPCILSLEAGKRQGNGHDQSIRTPVMLDRSLELSSDSGLKEGAAKPFVLGSGLDRHIALFQPCHDKISVAKSPANIDPPTASAEHPVFRRVRR